MLTLLYIAQELCRIFVVFQDEGGEMNVRHGPERYLAH